MPVMSTVNNIIIHVSYSRMHFRFIYLLFIVYNLHPILNLSTGTGSVPSKVQEG